MVGGIGVRGHPRPLVSLWFPPLPRSRRPPSGISHAPHPWQRSRIGIAPPDRQGKCGQGCPRTRVEPTHAETRWCESVIPGSGVGRECQSKASRIKVERRYLPESFQASTKRCNGPGASVRAYKSGGVGSEARGWVAWDARDPSEAYSDQGRWGGARVSVTDGSEPRRPTARGRVRPSRPGKPVRVRSVRGPGLLAQRPRWGRCHLVG